MQFLPDHDIDIVLVQETLLKTANRFKIPNHDVYRNHRDNERGGGTTHVIKNLLSYCEMAPPRTSQFENTRGQLLIGNTTIIMLSIYRQPHVTTSNKDLEVNFNHNTILVAAGDYNTKHDAWNSAVTH